MTSDPMDEGPGRGPSGGSDRHLVGLRNPGAAVRGVARRRSRPRGWCCCSRSSPCGCSAHLTGLAIDPHRGLAVVCFVLAGLLRHRWAWPPAAVLQVVLFGRGFVFHGSLAVLGVLFGCVWLRALRPPHGARSVTVDDRSMPGPRVSEVAPLGERESVAVRVAERRRPQVEVVTAC